MTVSTKVAQLPFWDCELTIALVVSCAGMAQEHRTETHLRGLGKKGEIYGEIVKLS